MPRLHFNRRLQLLLGLFFALCLYVSLVTLFEYENAFSHGYDYEDLPDTPYFISNFYRQFFDYLDTPLVHCDHLVRFGKVITWYEPHVCVSDPFNIRSAPDCLVYSFHHAASRDNYLAFEAGAAKLGCEVHIFDLVGDLVQHVQGDIEDGSIKWHVVGGPNDEEHFVSLEDIVKRLNHEDRTINYMRMFVDFDVDRKPRQKVFLKQLQFLVHGELPIIRAQVQQLQLAMAFRPVSLKPSAVLNYRRIWEIFNELHRSGFRILDSRSTSRVGWLPGLGEPVASQYNVLWVKNMPPAARLKEGGDGPIIGDPVDAELPNWSA